MNQFKKKDMKKLLISLFVLISLMLTPGAINTPAYASVYQGGGWTKSTDGVWVGKDMKCYKMEGSRMMISRDAKSWVPAPNGLWQDKSGKWLTIQNKTLKSSPDKMNWTEVKDSKWTGGNGKVYKFDKDMNLMVMKGGTGQVKKKTK